MILTFSPQQACEVSDAFDASWLMNAALATEAASHAATVACNNKTKSTAADNDDNKADKDDKADAEEKTSPASANKKKGAACQKKTVQPCQRHNQNAQARCNRRCARAKAQQQQKKVEQPPPPTRIVVQRSPIHMDDSNPEFAKMSLDVTGFAPHQIKVSVDDYVVSISGERRNKLGDLFVIDRKFRLDKKTALVDSVEASFDNDDVAGILEIVVPKNVSAGPRTIPIAVTSSSSAKNETEVVESVDDETAEVDNANNETAAPTDEEEQNHPTEEVTSVETVEDDDGDDEADDHDEEAVEDEQQTDADSGGDVAVNEGLEWEEVAEEKE